MRFDKNFAYFRPHFDWYTFKIGYGYIPTDIAPPEAIKAMQEYNAYTYKTTTTPKHKSAQKKDDSEK